MTMHAVRATCISGRQIRQAHVNMLRQPVCILVSNVRAAAPGYHTQWSQAAQQAQCTEKAHILEEERKEADNGDEAI